jgi:hypothetical protein
VGHERTRSGRVLSKVTSLVSAEETFRLGIRSWAPRKLFVEADYTLHAGGILCGANSLDSISQCSPRLHHDSVVLVLNGGLKEDLIDDDNRGIRTYGWRGHLANELVDELIVYL